MKRILQARWFPVVTKPLLSGFLAALVVYGLRRLGVTSVVPWEVNNAITPLVGLLVAAIAQPPSGPAPKTTGPSLGQHVAQALLDDVAQVIDSDPTLYRSLAQQALQRVLGGTAPPAPVVKAVIGPVSPPPTSQAAEGLAEGVVR